jgi:alpha-galactosidase|eukprot:SAG25_NODE_1028_length_4237_cov_2.549058_2_plen_48_part_00
MWLSAPRGRNAWACDVNETLMRQTIDAFVTLGLKDAGFEYVSMDGAQ